MIENAHICTLNGKVNIVFYIYKSPDQGYSYWDDWKSNG